MAEAAAHAVEAEQRKKDKQKGYRQAAVAKALSKKRKLARGLSDEDYLDVEEEDVLDPWDMSRQPSKKKGKAVSAVSANAPTKKRKAVSAVSANAPTKKRVKKESRGGSDGEAESDDDGDESSGDEAVGGFTKKKSKIKKGGVQVPMSKNLERLIILERIEKEEDYKNAGNGNKKRKKEIWAALCNSIVGTYPEVVDGWLNPAVAERKWQYVIAQVKRYLEHCARSGKDRAVVPACIVTTPDILDYAYTRTDMSLIIANSAGCMTTGCGVRDREEDEEEEHLPRNAPRARTTMTAVLGSIADVVRQSLQPAGGGGGVVAKEVQWCDTYAQLDEAKKVHTHLCTSVKRSSVCGLPTHRHLIA
jgi:hypothetical protein